MRHEKNAGQEDRLLFLDNLRTFIIFGVVCFHCGWVYESSGLLSSVWIVNDPSKNNLAGLVNLVMDMFMMPIMFFISGYFSPLSLQKKKGFAFLVSRFKRLMVPWIFAVLTLIPLYKVIYLFSRGYPQGNPLSYFHFSGGIMINQGWLWFLPVLFLFDSLYCGLSRIKPMGLKMNLKGSVISVFLIGFIYSFYMSWFGHYGWTKTILLDFQNERLLIYFMAFLIGALCFKLEVFSTKPTQKKLYYFLCATIWIPMNVYIVFLINLVLNPGQFIISGFLDIALVWLAFHLSLLGLGYVMINSFRYYLNKSGKIIQRLNNCSFGVYIVHFIIMGAIALCLLKTTIPSLAKYALLTVSTYVASNLIMLLVNVLKSSVGRKAMH